MSQKSIQKVIIDTYNNKNEKKIINQKTNQDQNPHIYNIHQHMHDQTNKTKQKKIKNKKRNERSISASDHYYTFVCLWKGTYMEFMFPFKPVLNNFIVKNAENIHWRTYRSTHSQ